MATRVLDGGRRPGFATLGGLSLLALTAFLVAGSLVALGYFGSSGSGVASASIGDLNAPANVSAVATGSSVTVTWAAVTAPGGGVGYTVTRSGTSSSDVCGFPTPTASTTCTDSAVPNGTFTYTVAAVWRSWRSSTASNAVAITTTKLTFTTPPRAITAGATTGTITVERQDAAGNPTTSGTATLNLASTSGGSFLDLSGAVTITSVSIPDGSSSASFKYRDTAAGTPTITAADGSGALTSATQGVTVTAANGSTLVYLTSPRTSTAGISSGTITVQRQDAYGNPATDGSLTIGLTSSSPGAAFYDPSDTSQLTQITLGNGTSSGSFLYRDTVAGSPVVTAADQAGTLASATQTESVSAAAAARFVFVGSALAGAASSTASLGPATVQRQDSFGNPVSVGSTTVNLASSTTGTAVFAASLNGVGVTSLTIAAGSSSVAFYYGDSKAGAPVVTVSGTLASATQTESVSAAAAAKLAVTQQPSSATGGAAFPTQPKVTVDDAFGNAVTSDNTTVVVLTLGANPGSGTLTCGNATASSGVAAFAGCKIDKAGTGYTLIASKSGGGLATATTAAFDIAVGPAAQFVVSASGTATAGTAIPSITLTADDAGGNLVTSYSGIRTITWSGATTSPAGNAPVYPVTSVSFTNGASTTPLSATLYGAGVTTLTATAAPVTGAATVNVSPAAQQALRFVTTSSGTTNACPSDQVGNGVSLTAFVAVLDAYGNLAANGGSPLTVTIARVTGGGNSPSPGSLTVSASANPAVTSGSTLLKLPAGSVADTTYTATSGALTPVSCILRKN